MLNLLHTLDGDKISGTKKFQKLLILPIKKKKKKSIFKPHTFGVYMSYANVFENKSILRASTFNKLMNHNAVCTPEFHYCLFVQPVTEHFFKKGLKVVSKLINFLDKS